MSSAPPPCPSMIVGDPNNMMPVLWTDCRRYHLPDGFLVVISPEQCQWRVPLWAPCVFALHAVHNHGLSQLTCNRWGYSLVVLKRRHSGIGGPGFSGTVTFPMFFPRSRKSLPWPHNARMEMMFLSPNIRNPILVAIESSVK